MIWLPGFTSDKESVQANLRDLAARGYVALSFDPVDHGQRSRPVGEAVLDPAKGDFRAEMVGVGGEGTSLWG